MKSGTEPETTTSLLTIRQAAAHWNRSPHSIYEEIEDHDYREEQGVFFRHLAKPQWRINEFQYMYWRRLPPEAMSDAQIKQFSDFLLQHIEPTMTALMETKRFLLAQREAMIVRLEQHHHVATTNHTGGPKP